MVIFLTADNIKNRINEICTLFGFEYNGIRGYVDPFSETSFDLFYDGKTTQANSIDEVMSTPFFDGKALNDICDKIEITEW